MYKLLIYLIFPALMALSCGNKDAKTTTDQNKPEPNKEAPQDKTSQKKDTLQKTVIFNIKSSAFTAEGTIPQKYACDGDNISPPLLWAGAPTGVKSFALIVDDPDAPNKTHVHWVVYNIPANATELSENVPDSKKLPSGAIQGTNDDNKTGYSGPCPPNGTHRYYFKLYALDITTDIKGDATKDKLLDAMKGHVLAEAELMGKYSKE